MIVTDPPALAAWLATARSAVIVDAYTIINANGATVVRWLSGDFDFTLPTPDLRVFVRGPAFERSDIQQSVGLSVDNMDITMRPYYKRQAVLFGAQTLLQAAQSGVLRGATLQLERLVFATGPSDYQGRWVEFAGTLAIKNTAGGVIKAQVLSELNLLDKPMPPDVYQPQCRNTVFNASCGLSRAAWAAAGAVTSTATRSQFSTAMGQAASYFDQGVVQVTSGANAGEKRTVKSFAGGIFTFALPWPQDFQVGDTLSAVPGCNRSLDVCTNKFNNRIRFRGEPFIPQPETVN
jgi:uncharacterized phage protein (TIGR02218 family)